MNRAKLSETDVILNFMEDCHREFISDPTIQVEFPAGSWSGSRNRNVADIHGAGCPGIEAKGNFADAQRDLHNRNKNNNIRHYIYSSPLIDVGESGVWEKNNIAAAVFLTISDCWHIINDHDGLFRRALRAEKIHEISR
jgi:hypothetical protein